MNLHIPPGRLEGSLCCLYGDRWPLALVCPCQQLCRLSVGSCANLLYCCELSSAGCERLSTVSIGLFVLCYALFLPGLWILDMSSIAPIELLVAWGFFLVHLLYETILEGSFGIEFKEKNAQIRESKCPSLTFVEMDKNYIWTKGSIFPTWKLQQLYTTPRVLLWRTERFFMNCVQETALFVGLASFKSVKPAFATKGIAFPERHRHLHNTFLQLQFIQGS